MKQPEPTSARQNLVDLAAEEFAEKGYAGVSVRDLAARSQVTTGALYHHFKGKPDLLLAAIDAHIADDLVNLPSDGSATIAGVLANIFAHYPERERLRALLVEGAIAARSDDQAGERLRDDTERRLRDWSDVYRSWQASGEIDSELDVHAVLVALWSIELGLGVLEALGVELPAPEDMGDVMAHFVGGLARTPVPARSDQGSSKRAVAANGRASTRSAAADGSKASRRAASADGTKVPTKKKAANKRRSG